MNVHIKEISFTLSLKNFTTYTGNKKVKGNRMYNFFVILWRRPDTKTTYIHLINWFTILLFKFTNENLTEITHWRDEEL